MSSLFVVVTYDIIDDKRLRKVANCLENFGVRVQYSVFECYLTEAQWQQLNRQLLSLIEPEEDKLRLYTLCPKDIRRVIIDGQGEISKNNDYHMV